MVTGDIKNGYKFRKGNNFCLLMTITYGLFTNEAFTDEEILAVLLHETGHNFADAIFDEIELGNRNMMLNYKKFLIAKIIGEAILSVLTLGLALPFLVRDINTLNKGLNNAYKNKSQKQKQSKPGSVIKSILNGIKGKYGDVNMFINELLNRLGGGDYLERVYRYLDGTNRKEEIRNSLGRKNEVIADKFAGIYGYGPAQASALLKMDSYKSAAHKLAATIDKNANKSYEEAIFKINDYDVHPQSIQRALEEVKLLKNELKSKDLDPKLKKVIETQLNQLYDIIEQYSTTSKTLSETDNARRLYNAYINDECPDAVDKEVEDKIEKAFNDALKKK
jgi:hypothetical protein